MQFNQMFITQNIEVYSENILCAVRTNGWDSLEYVKKMLKSYATKLVNNLLESKEDNLEE